MHVFAELICKGVEHVTIIKARKSNRLQIVILEQGKNQLLSPEEVEQFAKNDGFESSEEMASWFFSEETDDLLQQWNGVIVHWTDKRYFKLDKEIAMRLDEPNIPKTFYTYFLEDIQIQHPLNVLPTYKFNGKDMKLLFIKEDVFMINSNSDISPLIAKIDVGLKRMEGREVTKGKVLFNVKPGRKPDVHYIKSI
ncbi:MAG: hypothetical protein EKK63_01725 [Acinetobacter sp.]|uniref:hypothetical protein n=1 Tax=Acinetobacter sp. TaxID=472 RepID=UPI000F917EA4|nr:hypothetical protein [Acinetobacter sp.]RUP42324.1 MAG: hypothetical protein EKK63_01725 [Acinetobacter sp.]